MTHTPSSSPRPTTALDALASARWTPLQLLVVALCFVVNMLDGMDVLILSYIAPTLQTDWGIGADRMGIVFSAGILGMAIGGIVIAPLADYFGRRLLVIAALATSTAAMIASGFVSTVSELMVLRVFVGIGIGAVLASMAALISEYAPDRDRNFAVGLLYAGYPLGAIVTGLIAVWAIPTFGWKAVLMGAGLVSAIMLPVLLVLLPESMEFLVKRSPKGALARLNRILTRLDRPTLDALPEAPASARRSGGVAGLFAEGRARSTLLLWGAMIAGFMALWFVISWIPKLAILSGLDQSQGIYAGAVFNLGAFGGTILLGWIARKAKLQKVILVFLLAAAVVMMIFGAVRMPVMLVLAVAFLIGIFLQGGFNGIYPLAARLYPAEVRSTGIGWTTGVGRIGAVLGPALGGFLLERETPLWLIFAIFATPAAVGAVLALLVKLPSEPEAAA